MRFHAIAPISAPKMRCASMYSGEMMPLPMVEATLSSKTPMARRLKNAAQMTAWYGRSTPVETTVAMEFAAS
jgi:hypothetical protein